MRPLQALAAVVVLASLAACSSSDSDPDTSPKTDPQGAEIVTRGDTQDVVVLNYPA